ncbi:hypothetical protein BDR06DRAFT_825015, partial [Suillus hirtellus]
LYLIDGILRKNGKSLQAIPQMPVSQMAARWGVMEGNQLIYEQLQYDREQLQQMVEPGVNSLNAEQRAVFDAVVNDAMQHNDQRPGHAYFVHSTGGCGKTYLCKLIASKIRAEGKIVLCVASSGIASLLLPGGRTAHS